MKKLRFPGQQSGERILYLAKPHRVMMYINFLKILTIGLLTLAALQALAIFFASPIFGIAGLIFSGALMFIGILVAYTTHEGYKTYITDRRVIRFEPTFPFRERMRSLFWDEVEKTKTFRKNYLLEGLFKIGSITIHPKSNAEYDDIQLNYLTYHEDLANYIDKILYIFRNHPSELKTMQPFIPMPKGQRG